MPRIFFILFSTAEKDEWIKRWCLYVINSSTLKSNKNLSTTSRRLQNYAAGGISPSGEQSTPVPANFFLILEFGGELHSLLYTLAYKFRMERGTVLILTSLSEQCQYL